MNLTIYIFDIRIYFILMHARAHMLVVRENRVNRAW